jgi:hypothetical protein
MLNWLPLLIILSRSRRNYFGWTKVIEKREVLTRAKVLVLRSFFAPFYSHIKVFWRDKLVGDSNRLEAFNLKVSFLQTSNFFEKIF